MEFSKEEYQRRVSEACKRMASLDIDAIVLTADWMSSINYRYLSGHLPRDFQVNLSRPHIFVLTQDGVGSILALHFSAAHAKKTSWVSDVASYSEPFHGSEVVSLLRRLGLERARIGWELGERSRLCMPMNDYLYINKHLPNAEFVDVSKMLRSMRLIKSTEEIEKIRQAAEINGRALQKAYRHRFDRIPSEREIYKQVVKNIISDHPSPRPPFGQILTMSSTGFRNHGGGLSQFLAAENEPLRTGDIIIVDSGTAVDGYWAEYSRMAVVGEPTKVQKEKHSHVRTLVQQTIDEVVRPGVSGEKLIDHLISIYKDLGYSQEKYEQYINFPYRHLGHGLGLEASEEPMLNQELNESLKPGMVIAVECSIEFSHIRYATEETVLVSESGAEILSLKDDGLFSIQV